MRGNQKNKNYQIKWNPEFAYVIGLLTTDGNLSKDGRHIAFTSKDIQLVKSFKGCFDGDGSFYSYWDPRWKSSFMFYTTFCSSSLTFIRWLRKRIKQLININGHVNANKLKTIWQLKFAKGESKELWRELYYSTEIPFLKRKYLKIKRAQMEELEDSHP